MYLQFKTEAEAAGMTFEDYFDSLITPESIANVLNNMVGPQNNVHE